MTKMTSVVSKTATAAASIGNNLKHSKKPATTAAPSIGMIVNESTIAPPPPPVAAAAVATELPLAAVGRNNSCGGSTNVASGSNSQQKQNTNFAVRKLLEGQSSEIIKDSSSTSINSASLALAAGGGGGGGDDHNDTDFCNNIPASKDSSHNNSNNCPNHKLPSANKKKQVKQFELQQQQLLSETENKMATLNASNVTSTISATTTDSTKSKSTNKSGLRSNYNNCESNFQVVKAPRDNSNATSATITNSSSKCDNINNSNNKKKKNLSSSSSYSTSSSSSSLSSSSSSTRSTSNNNKKISKGKCDSTSVSTITVTNKASSSSSSSSSVPVAMTSLMHLLNDRLNDPNQIRRVLDLIKAEKLQSSELLEDDYVFGQLMLNLNEVDSCTDTNFFEFLESELNKLQLKEQSPDGIINGDLSNETNDLCKQLSNTQGSKKKNKKKSKPVKSRLMKIIDKWQVRLVKICENEDKEIKTDFVKAAKEMAAAAAVAAAEAAATAYVHPSKRIINFMTTGAFPHYPGSDEKKLYDILDRTGYSLELSNGQRKFGPPPNWSGHLPNGSEIFVGRISKEIFEDELIPLFETIGKIWDLRLMIDPNSGYSRGYAFVTFFNHEDALLAVEKFDNYEIRKNRPLKVNISVPNVRLFIGNIPKEMSKEDIFQEFQKQSGLADVIVYHQPNDRRRNRGFCFLEFETHKHASQAKRKLATQRVKVWGAEILVDWAEPLEEPDEETMSKVRVLYVRNLATDMAEEYIKDIFGQYGPVERVKKIKDYAFVHFEERDFALHAMDQLNGQFIDGSQIEISLAKPPSDKKRREEVLRNRERRLMYMMNTKPMLLYPSYSPSVHLGGPNSASYQLSSNAGSVTPMPIHHSHHQHHHHHSHDGQQQQSVVPSGAATTPHHHHHSSLHPHLVPALIPAGMQLQSGSVVHHGGQSPSVPATAVQCPNSSVGSVSPQPPATHHNTHHQQYYHQHNTPNQHSHQQQQHTLPYQLTPVAGAAATTGPGVARVTLGPPHIDGASPHHSSSVNLLPLPLPGTTNGHLQSSLHSSSTPNAVPNVVSAVPSQTDSQLNNSANVSKNIAHSQTSTNQSKVTSGGNLLHHNSYGTSSQQPQQYWYNCSNWYDFNQNWWYQQQSSPTNQPPTHHHHQHQQHPVNSHSGPSATYHLSTGPSQFVASSQHGGQHHHHHSNPHHHQWPEQHHGSESGSHYPHYHGHGHHQQQHYPSHHHHQQYVPQKASNDPTNGTNNNDCSVELLSQSGSNNSSVSSATTVVANVKSQPASATAASATNNNQQSTTPTRSKGAATSQPTNIPTYNSNYSIKNPPNGANSSGGSTNKLATKGC